MIFQIWYCADFDRMTITPVELEPSEEMVRIREAAYHEWISKRTRTRVYVSTEAEGRQEMARFIRMKIERCEVVIAKERGVMADYARRLGEFEGARERLGKNNG